MLKLFCKDCGKPFDARHRRRHPHCAQCAQKLRSKGFGPIQSKRIEEVNREGNKPISKQSALTLQQFASQLLGWYQIWAPVNSAYFPVEKRLSEKALNKGYLEISDLVDITRVLGNPYNIRNKLQSNNTADSVIQKTRNAILNIGEPLKALQCICSIKYWGLAFGSKTLRCICPEKYGALDSRIVDGVNRNYLPSNNNYVKYVEFLQLCEQIRQRVTQPGPRDKGEWYMADIEIALFQFLWNRENRLL